MMVHIKMTGSENGASLVKIINRVLSTTKIVKIRFVKIYIILVS